MSSSTRRTFPEHNDLIRLLRALAMTGGRKRGGAKYGPPPKNPPPERMQSPKPLDWRQRAENYRHSNGKNRFTHRQSTQLLRMGERSGETVRRWASSLKAAPTPKRVTR